MLKYIFKSILYLVYVFIVVFVLLEVTLRIWNPIPQRIVGSKLNLPRNQKYVLPNTNFTKISKNGIHTKNSLGFRGPELEQSKGKIKILTVGGSTTECFYVDDKNTWANILNEDLNKNHSVWLNNAGLNGHSTIGHITLLNAYLPIVKPDYVLFLVGINDAAVAENQAEKFDDELSEQSSYKHLLFLLDENSRVINLIHSFYRGYQAKKMGLADNMEWTLVNNPDLRNHDEKRILARSINGQTAYENRLMKIIEICKANHTQAIFVTQPLLFGDKNEIDPVTKINLSTYSIHHVTGAVYWHKVELFNNTLRKVAEANHIPLIDLAQKMDKNSAYYIDEMHFSDLGCKEVANIIDKDLENIIK